MATIDDLGRSSVDSPTTPGGPATARIELHTGLLASSPEDAIDTLAHELRHAVDDAGVLLGRTPLVGREIQQRALLRGQRGYDPNSGQYLANTLEKNANQSGHDVSRGWLEAQA